MNVFFQVVLFFSRICSRLRYLVWQWRYSRLCVRQYDVSDCGAAAVVSIMSFWGVRRSLSSVRRSLVSGANGTTLYAMASYLRSAGFEASGMKGGSPAECLEALGELPLPLIVHLEKREGCGHFSVLVRSGKDSVLLMDPAEGAVGEVPVKEFVSAWTGVVLIAVPAVDSSLSESETGSFSGRIMPLLKPYAGLMLRALAGAFVYTVFGLAQSVYLKKSVDTVIPEANLNLANLLGISMMAIIAVSAVVNFMRERIVMRVGIHIDAALLMGYYRRLLSLPLSFFDRMRSGDIISRVNDIALIRLFVNETLMSLVLGLSVIMMSGFMLFFCHWKLALILMLSVPFYFCLYFIYNSLNRKVRREILERASELQSHLVETFSAVRTVRQFGMSSRFSRKMEALFVRLLEKGYESFTGRISMNFCTEILSRVFTVITVWVGSYYVVSGEMTPGELLSFHSLIAYFISPLSSVISVNMQYQDARIAVDRVFEVMEEDADSDEGKMDIGRLPVPGVSFENVRFAYNGRKMLFNGLSVEITPGAVTGIAGSSGCGKSTLIALLQNMYSPQEGSVRIGGFDVRSISSESLRSSISVVPQKVELFDGSLIENIVADGSSPDWERVTRIVQALAMEELVNSLPLGFASQLGENGALLSGGQRQKVAIARAVYRNPSVLVLDEATSSLDPFAESTVMDFAAALARKGCTVIVAAHRLASLMKADRILVMDQGRIVEEGRPEQLAASGGPFSEMLDLQGYRRR